MLMVTQAADEPLTGDDEEPEEIAPLSPHTPVASVVLMIPIAVDTAEQIGANGFAFLLAVMFAASSAFMTPVGYQTNLMVYGQAGTGSRTTCAWANPCNSC